MLPSVAAMVMLALHLAVTGGAALLPSGALQPGSVAGGTGRALLQSASRPATPTASYATKTGANYTESGTSYNNPTDFPVPSGYV